MSTYDAAHYLAEWLAPVAAFEADWTGKEPFADQPDPAALAATARATREAMWAEVRPLAVARYLAHNARYYQREEETYTVDDLPDYKAPGTYEFESHVAGIQRDILMDRAMPTKTVPPFAGGDWSTVELVPEPLEQAKYEASVQQARQRGAVDYDAVQRLAPRGKLYEMPGGRLVPMDARVERSIDGVIEDASAPHDEMHAEWKHPFCLGCWAREGASPLIDGDLNMFPKPPGALREAVEGRVRRYLLLHDGKAPKHPASLDDEGPVRRWHDEQSLAEMPAPEWLLKGLLPMSGVGYIIGRDGTKKTFFALDIVMSVITGTEFHGREVHDEAYNGAMFVVGEGVNAFGTRIKAWREARGVAYSADQAPAAYLNGSVNLFTGDDGYRELLAKAKRELPDIIVLDTLQRCTQGADQNSAADMSVVSARLLELKHASGGVVLVVAHTDKGDNDARGSSSIEDDADFVIHVKDKDGVVEARVTKQKDGVAGSSLRLVPEAHAGSIALASASDSGTARETLGGSSVRLRILNVLRLAEGEHLDDAAVHRGVTTRDAPVAGGTVANHLREMAKNGEVRKELTGSKNKAYYWLDPVQDAPETA